MLAVGSPLDPEFLKKMDVHRADAKKAATLPSSSGTANPQRSAGTLVINEPTAQTTVAVSPPPPPPLENPSIAPSSSMEASLGSPAAEDAPRPKKVDKGKRPLTSSSGPPSVSKRARGNETAPGTTTVDDYIVFCPEWDVRRSDSFFENIEDRPAALSAFNAFVLPRDIPRLRDVPVDECFDTSKILLAQSLSYYTAGTERARGLEKDYAGILEKAERAQLQGKEALDQRDQALESCKKAERRLKRKKEEVLALQKEKEELEKRKAELEKEKADWMLEMSKIQNEKEGDLKEKESLKKKKHKLEKEKKELSDQVAKLTGELKEAKTAAVADFKTSSDFAQAIEKATFDKFGQGYDACQGFAAAKGLDSSLLDFDAFVAYSIASANPVAEETKAEEEQAEAEVEQEVAEVEQLEAEVRAESAPPTATGEGEEDRKEENTVTIE